MGGFGANFSALRNFEESPWKLPNESMMTFIHLPLEVSQVFLQECSHKACS